MVHSPKIGRSKDLMLTLGLTATIDQLDMANSIHRYYGVVRKEDGHVLRKALEFEVEGQWTKGGREGHGRDMIRWKL